MASERPQTARDKSKPRVGTANWEALSRDQQLEVLTGLCLRQARRYKKEFDEVLAVGVGYKTSKRRLLESLCLAFLVHEKTDAKRLVPPIVSTFFTVDGKRVKVDVPTDVEELKDGGPQAGVNAADGITVNAANSAGLACTGAVCCLARQTDQPQNVFLVGCHHVLAMSSKTSNCQATLGIVSDTAGVPFAQLFDYVPMAANVSSQVDAAIALVSPGADVTWAHTGMRPLRTETGTEQPSNCMVFTPRGAFPAAYVKTWLEVPLLYPSCGSIQIERAYQFQAATQPGDSGSAVMGLDGTLYGMHFWGRPSDQFAMAIPAGGLFRPGLFKVGIALAP